MVSIIYLGNVRVVLTEEDATYTEKFLTTLEEVHRQIEEKNFDNVGETAEDLPTGYPVDGSAELNEKIALLSATNGTEIGRSIVMPVRRGDQVSLRTDYFYTEDAPGATYDNLNMLVNEVLLALAASGSGVLRLTEGQLIDLAAGGNQYSTAIGSFFSSSFDTTDVSKPFGYLVWMLYDNDMNLLPAGSGAKRVTDPNELKDLLEENIPVVQDGYLHAYVSNGSASNVSFDNFLITYMRGQTRQINHYYPYGLSIDGLDHSDEYLHKYTSKELQTGEFFSQTSSGLEMFDFGSRFYDPQVGRWFTPDPAEQFANPYLAMGNNPVMYVDPDGEFIIASAIIIGAMIGSFTGAVAAGYSGATNGQIMASFGIGALSGAASGAVAGGTNALISGERFICGALSLASTSTTGFLAGAATGAAAGITNGFIHGTGNALVSGNNIGDAINNGLDQAWKQGVSGAVFGGIIGGIDAASKGRNFWTGDYKQYNLKPSLLASNDKMLSDPFEFPDNATVANADDYRVFYKTEDPVKGLGSYPSVKPGKYIVDPIDGVATSKYTNQVFKVPTGGRVLVRMGGDVTYTNGYGFYEGLSFINRGGWQNASYFRDLGAYEQWQPLFRIAPIIKNIYPY